MSAARVFVDTNVLVYSMDKDEPVKRPVALALLGAVSARGNGAINAQVIGEFFVTATRRFCSSMDTAEAAFQTLRLADMFIVYDTSLAIIEEALRGVVGYKMSFYDAQIWAVARINQIPVVLSEDFSDGGVIEGVRFANPFAPAFDLEAALSV
ncbi:MAG: PIN domain-containing protein [Coriobacteriia bacterium]